MLLLNVTSIDWVPGRLKRNQAIFTHLLDSNAELSGGVYLNPPKIAGDGARKYLPGFGCAIRQTATPGGKPVTLIDSTYTLWDWYFPAIARLRATRVARWLDREIIRGRPFLHWINTAGKLQTALSAELAPKAWKTVSDWSDNFSVPGTGIDPANIQSLSRISDRVLCVNEAVAATISHPNKTVFHNCTDPSAFASWDPDYRLEPWWPKPAGATYIGFTGGFQTIRMDRDLLEYLFRRFPSYRFLFIGYTDSSSVRQWLDSFPNASFVDEVPYAVLTHLIHSFDAAIVPHADNEHTRGNDLLKVLDYFACSVPVVSTYCSGLEKYGDALYLARTAEAFGDHLERLASAGSGHDGSKGLQIAKDRSWTNQTRRLGQLLFSGTDFKK